MEINNVTNKWSPISVVIGIFLLLILIPLIQKPSWVNLYILLLSIYLIITGILNNRAIFTIIIGIGLIIIVLISISFQIFSLLEILLFVITSILCLLLGTLAYLGYISEKRL
jgi:hypothetical protein